MSAKTVTVEQLARALKAIDYGEDETGFRLFYGNSWATIAVSAENAADTIFAAIPEWVPDVVRDATDPPTDSEGNPATLVATYVGLAVTDQVYLGQVVEDVLAAAVALRKTKLWQLQYGPTTEAFIDAVDAYIRASTPEPKL